MASDWATSNRKKKNAKSKPKQITYSYEFILKFKDINSQEQITFELSSLFDKINEMFKTSTQYIESKKKINYNQLNHNKWEKRKDHENNVINLVYSAFNRVSNINKEDIKKELLELEMIVYTDLEKLVEKIINKCISENQYISLYIEMIKFIITDCKWIVQDSYLVPITFRKIFINQLETRFDNMLNDIINMKYEADETELMEIHRQNKKGLILMLGNLYKYKIISNQLTRLIFNYLEISYDENKNFQYIEYWILFLDIIIDYWKDEQKIYLDEKINYINSIMDILPYRIKFLLQETLTRVNIDSNDIKSLVKEDSAKEEEIKYDLLIMSSLEYENLTEWFNDIQDKIININDFMLDVITCTMSDKKMINKIKDIIIYLNEIKYLDNEKLIEIIETVIETYDISDYPYFKIHLNEYKNLL
jgi:hypothetical protein